MVNQEPIQSCIVLLHLLYEVICPGCWEIGPRVTGNTHGAEIEYKLDMAKDCFIFEEVQWIII